MLVAPGDEIQIQTAFEDSWSLQTPKEGPSTLTTNSDGMSDRNPFCTDQDPSVCNIDAQTDHRLQGELVMKDGVLAYAGELLFRIGDSGTWRRGPYTGSTTGAPRSYTVQPEETGTVQFVNFDPVWCNDNSGEIDVTLTRMGRRAPSRPRLG